MSVERQIKTEEIREPKSVSENDWKKVFWSDEDARLVGDFLQGKIVEKVGLTFEVLERLALNTDLVEDKETRDRQKKELRREGEELLKTVQFPEVSEVGESSSKIEFEDEYVSVNKLLGRTILQVTIGSLIKRRIMTEEGKKYLTRGAIREKAGYAYDESMGDVTEEVIQEEDRSPEMMIKQPEMIIKAPKYRYTDDGVEKVRNFGNRRFRASLAHEIGHVFRTLTNKLLWSGVDPDQAKLAKLRKSRKLLVGGYLVGSNQQGSEGIGKLFSDITVLKAVGKDTGVRDLITPTARRLEEKLKGTKVDPDHRIALTASLHHLIQLDRLGYGDVEAADLLALGICGYGGLEKMPDLIRAGVMTKDKYEKMKLVTGDILGWLTSPSEEGYRLA